MGDDDGAARLAARRIQREETMAVLLRAVPPRRLPAWPKSARAALFARVVLGLRERGAAQATERAQR